MATSWPRIHGPRVVLTGTVCLAAALLLQGWASAPPTEAPPAKTPDVVEQPLEVELADVTDPHWELTRVEVQLDGKPLDSSASEDDDASETSRTLWSGVVAPGPHTLIALLFFRPRVPADSDQPPQTVQVVTRHRWEARPIRPLVLLITPVRPAPPPAADTPIWAAIPQTD